jgi:predicted NBD/HSP70 family sugar kinase
VSAGVRPATLRRQNRSLVLGQVIENGPISRTQIARATGLTGAAVSRITGELIENGLLREGSTFAEERKAGPRFVQLQLNGDGAYVVGIGIGASEQAVSLANACGEVLVSRRINMPLGSDPQRAIAYAASETEELVRTAAVDRRRLLGVGVAIAGMVDHETGNLIRSLSLGWEGVPVGRTLEARLGLPVKVEGCANTVLLAESRRGVAKRVRNVVLVNVGLAIEGSLILDGQLMRGALNVAAQVGHLRVPGAEQLCSCGRRGCLNTVASGRAILKTAGDEHAGHVSAAKKRTQARRSLSAIEELKDRDSAAREILQRAGEQLGWAIHLLATLAHPELIVLSGAVAQLGSYVEGVRGALANSQQQGKEIPLVASATTSNEAVVWLALEEFVRSRDLDMTRLKAVNAV